MEENGVNNIKIITFVWVVKYSSTNIDGEATV